MQTRQPKQRLVSRTIHLVIREVYSYPSSAPFPAARRVIETTGVELGDSELPPSSRPLAAARPLAPVIELRKVG